MVLVSCVIGRSSSKKKSTIFLGCWLEHPWYTARRERLSRAPLLSVGLSTHCPQVLSAIPTTFRYWCLVVYLAWVTLLESNLPSGFVSIGPILTLFGLRVVLIIFTSIITFALCHGFSWVNTNIACRSPVAGRW
jgi:hypothetical protein